MIFSKRRISEIGRDGADGHLRRLSDFGLCDEDALDGTGMVPSCAVGPTMMTMMMNLRFMLLIASVVAFHVQDARAWWDTGHMIIAAVATQSMDAVTLMRAEDLMVASAAAQARLSVPSNTSLVSVSHWADDIKPSSSASFVLAPPSDSLFLAFDSHHFSEQHYIDFPVYREAQDENVCQQTSLESEINLETALASYFNILSSDGASAFAAGVALRFLVHIVGDLHQPLHTAAWCGARFPEGDAGGNAFKLDRGNLHMLWDSMGSAYADTIDALCPYRDYETCRRREDERVRACEAEAARLTVVYGDGDNESDSVEDMASAISRWIRESHDVAANVVYVGVEENVTASDAYMESVRETSRKMSVIAGRRLARVLTTALGARYDKQSGAGSADGNTDKGIGVVTFVITTLIVVVLSMALGFLVGTRRERRRKTAMLFPDQAIQMHENGDEHIIQ